MDNDWKVQDMAPCLNKRVEQDNCFLLMFFLDVLFNFLSFICVTEFSLACWYRFHVVHIAVMSKTYSYQKWNMDIFVLFNQQTQSLFTNTMFFFLFYVPFTCMCKPRSSSKFMISLFWWSLYSVYFDLSTLVSSKVFWLSIVLFSHAALTHTHRFQTLSWTRWNDWKAKICTMSPLTGENWWNKAGWNGKKMSCAVTYNGEGMVEAGIGSEKFLRIRILEILKETPFFGPSS